MRSLRIAAMLLIGAVIVSSSSLAQQSDKAAVMLESASQAELVDGNLEAAVKLYQQIVSAPGTGRSIAAAALLGLGRCYEQLGHPKARETYERLVSQYGDQPRETSLATARLKALADNTVGREGERSEIVVREVWSRPAPMISPGTGSNLVIFSDLSVHNPTTDETRRLVKGARAAAYPVLSPIAFPATRRQVAYLSWSGDLQASLRQAQGGRAALPARIELRVVAVDGSNDRALISTRDVPWLRPLAWSPNGEQILTDFERRDGSHELVLVAVENGATRVVKSVGMTSPQEVGFSPDGRYIAYHLPMPRDSRRLELFVVPVDQGDRLPERSYTVMFGADLAAKPASQQHAVHVLNRLTFGPRPGDIDRVAAQGIEAYIEAQLHPERIPDPLVETKLAGFTSLKMGLAELLERGGPFVPQGLRSRASIFEKRAMADRAAQRRALRGEDNTVIPTSDKSRRVLLAGQPEPNEIQTARLVRAVYSERQLFELMVDFWMNHFSINHTDHQQTPHFEEQVIRRHALGQFGDMLMGVAKHPRMLNYLDNWRSSAPADVIEQRLSALKPTLTDEQYLALMARGPFLAQAKGLNENYARELMELHTLGIDGGYTQKDIVEVARVLTGWTVSGEGIVNGREEDGVFKFDPLLHIDGDKIVLGRTIRSGGVDEGEQVIEMLARHPSTARFIATKLARRFVADDPPAEVVQAAARTFEQTGGDIREVLRTIFKSPQFLSAGSYRAKIKKPLELIVSSLRATNAEIEGEVFYNRLLLPRRGQLADMGERLYNYEAPDGNPDVGAAWMNSNALLVRLDFANMLSMGRLPGVKVDLAAARRLLEQLGMPQPTARQIEQTRAMTRAAAAPPRAATGQDGMMMKGAAADLRAEGATEVDPAALAVAAMLGSPQFQKK